MGWNDRMDPKELFHRFPEVYKASYPGGHEPKDCKQEPAQVFISDYCHYCGIPVQIPLEIWEKSEAIQKRPMHEECILAKFS